MFLAATNIEGMLVFHIGKLVVAYYVLLVTMFYFWQLIQMPKHDYIPSWYFNEKWTYGSHLTIIVEHTLMYLWES